MPRYRDIVAPGAEAAVWETALAIEAQAVDLCQKDTGELANTISTASKDRSHGFNSRGGAKGPDSARVRPPSGPLEVVVGTASDHAAAKEFGRPDMPNYPADPYLRPAAIEVKMSKGQVAKEAFEEAMLQYMQRYPYRKD